MTPQEFLREIDHKRVQLDNLARNVLPKIVGAKARDHFRDNIRVRSGFLNNGVQKWKPSKRIGKAKGAAGSTGTLLSDRKHLYNSIKSHPQPYEAHVTVNVPYAAVHNEGLRAGRGKGFQMPKRQFIGDSKELNEEVQKTIEQELEQILDDH